MCEISVAINRKYRTEGGEQKEETTYVDCTAWAKIAELMGERCKKGQPIFVTGRLQTDSWEDKTTGQKRNKLKVIVGDVQFLNGQDAKLQSGQGPGGASDRGQQRPTRQQPAAGPAEDLTGGMEEDDIPF